ncbi:MAG TPA: hypothetical protein VNG32_01850 [Candidatus Dormibacteraeota bacterium]|nr:hypothetical protein [Candidatus Dormibacteraeota bacterium]
MSEAAGERRLIEPSDALKEEFRFVVAASFGREPVNPKITVFMDRLAHEAIIETEVAGQNPGERAIVDTFYMLEIDGTLSKDLEGEPLGRRLARAIKTNTVNPQRDEYQQHLDTYRSMTGSTELEARLAVSEIQSTLPGGLATEKMLIRYLDAKSQQESLGLNTVDAFELSGVIQKIRDNFPIVPR